MLITDFVERPCPACSTTKTHQGCIVSCPTAESLTFNKLKSYWSGFFKEKIFFSYNRCHCGLLYCPIFFNVNQLQELYKNMPDNTAGVPHNSLLKTQEGYFNILKKYSSLKGDYLEFGPDIGLFTQHCIKEANFTHYWLCEPNQDVWPSLKNKIINHQHSIFSNIENNSNIAATSISTVVMIHVLDHVLDPVQMLKQLKPKLMRGAILLLVTHDEQSLLANAIKRKWPPYCLQHPQLFNKNSISTLLRNAGFQLLACKKTYNYFPITYLMKHVLHLFGIKYLKLPSLNKLQIALKLGNIITVATTGD